MYGWEPALEKSIDDIREKEMSLVRKAAVVKTCADLLNVAAPFFVGLHYFRLREAISGSPGLLHHVCPLLPVPCADSSSRLRVDYSVQPAQRASHDGC